MFVIINPFVSEKSIVEVESILFAFCSKKTLSPSFSTVTSLFSGAWAMSIARDGLQPPPARNILMPPPVFRNSLNFKTALSVIVTIALPPYFMAYFMARPIGF